MVWEQNQASNTLNAFRKVVRLIIHESSMIESHSWDLERLNNFSQDHIAREQKLWGYLLCQLPPESITVHGSRVLSSLLRDTTKHYPWVSKVSGDAGLPSRLLVYRTESCSAQLAKWSLFLSYSWSVCIFPTWCSHSCLKEWNYLCDLTWYLTLLLFLLCFSKATFSAWPFWDFYHPRSWFWQWERFTHSLLTVLYVSEISLPFLLLSLAVSPSSLHLCPPYLGVRRDPVIKVPHYQENRFPRTLDEVKVSINLQSILSKLAFHSLCTPISWSFALTCQKYWIKERNKM